MDLMQLERVCRNYAKVELLLSSYTVSTPWDYPVP